MLAFGFLALAGGVALHGWLEGWHVSKLSAAELEALLLPGYEYTRPDGPGPFPVVVQFHGCGGLFDNQRVWARAFQEAGWASVIVDSNGPRGLQWDQVCNGRALHGSERAGDVLVALAHARALPFVDPTRVVLAGWSHGAWSIMDLLAMNPPQELPHNLLESPAGHLSGVAGFIFVYPYCGFGARSVPWKLELPSLFLFAAEDTIAPPEVCLELAHRLRADAHPVSIHVLEGVNHAFDENHAPGGELSYDGDATARAQRRAVAFLSTLAGTQQSDEGDEE